MMRDNRTSQRRAFILIGLAIVPGSTEATKGRVIALGMIHHPLATHLIYNADYQMLPF